MAESLQPGHVLREHLFLPGSKRPLLRAGTMLTADQIARITALDMVGTALACVFGDERRTDGSRIVPLPAPSEPVLRPGEVDVLQEILAGRGSQSGLRRLIYDLACRLDGLGGPAEFRVPGAHEKVHPANVFMLSLAVAHALGYGPVQLVCLGTGALFHDLGKLVLPARLVGKPGPFTPEERSLMRHHPNLGVAVLARSRAFARWLFPREALEVIRFHHERLDGSGYPLGLAGTDIPRMAMVAAVAEIYDAMVSDSVHSRRKAPGLAYQTVRGMAGRLLDGVVVEAFLRRVQPYPPGTDVYLSDRRVARVLRVPENQPLRPVVVVGDAELDLAAERHVDIVGLMINRSENRVPSAIDVRVQTREGQPLPGKTVNLSPDGACLEVNGELPPGSHVEVFFYQSDRQIGTSRGNICWLAKGGDGSSRIGVHSRGANFSHVGRLAG